ncbi:DsrE family protein [Cellulomonas cellasea]|uniref:DsrE family protein n=1 Tax=Cellulomonas cellasea TaxID=43670 RepID=UPI0025A3BC40|nr:DsrE family protein [Cellulomonas cellasea]MDM8083762.1 DsrE family protein [Cellulomonas cellasea]
MSEGVTLHLDEDAPSKQASVLRNALHLLPEVPAGTPIEVVVHGEGISLARPGGPVSVSLAEALAAGITLVACHNTMQAQGLTSDDLVPQAVVVPSGVGHLVRRQREGWAYVRP